MGGMEGGMMQQGGGMMQQNMMQQQQMQQQQQQQQVPHDEDMPEELKSGDPLEELTIEGMAAASTAAPPPPPPPPPPSSLLCDLSALLSPLSSLLTLSPPLCILSPLLSPFLTVCPQCTYRPLSPTAASTPAALYTSPFSTSTTPISTSIGIVLFHPRIPNQLCDDDHLSAEGVEFHTSAFVFMTPLRTLDSLI